MGVEGGSGGGGQRGKGGEGKKGGEMTQTFYSHMNKIKLFLKKKLHTQKKVCLLGLRFLILKTESSESTDAHSFSAWSIAGVQ
jgi:hypothetical protein